MKILCVLSVILFVSQRAWASLSGSVITDPNFVFGNEPHHVSIYRLVGNDMPPLQQRGQLRWNTEYALVNEVKFLGAQKKWILNRIWNETEFSLLYGTLLQNGVKRQDIISRCFDFSAYASYKNDDDKMFYLTSQNEARNDGIINGRDEGFEWSVILDGNTFLTEDGWSHLLAALNLARDRNQAYVSYFSFIVFLF